MSEYRLRDQDGCELIEADDLAEARETAIEWVLGGEWDPRASTYWVTVWIEEASSGEVVDSVKVPIEPPEPVCSEAGGHDWAEAGVQGHGGGVRSFDECRHCACRRITNTWATDPATGEQGLTSVGYEP